MTLRHDISNTHSASGVDALPAGATAAHTKINELLDRTSSFWKTPKSPKEELISRFLDKEKEKEYTRVGTIVSGIWSWAVLDIVGNRNRFHRL